MVLDLLSVKAWAMESRFFERVYPLALDMISRGQDLSKLDSLNKEAAIFPESNTRDMRTGIPVFQAVNSKKVGMIRIAGAFTKTGELCAYGTRDYVSFIQAAGKSENIDALVIEIDSPGGSVDGTPELAKAIKESEKAVVMFADNLVASAAYWISSQASEIVANGDNQTVIGSIGALFLHPDFSKVVEAGNFPDVKIIRAPQSKDKALINRFEPISEDQEKLVLEDLKQITEDFISTIKAGRGERLQAGDENIFTGKMYGAEKALEMGMIDSIGDRQSAIDRAGELANERKLSVPAVSGDTNKAMNFKKLGALLSGKADAEANEELSAEEVQATLVVAEQKLAEQESTITRLEAQVNTLTDEKSGLEAEVETLKADVAAKQEELDKDPAGVATTIIAKEDEFEDDDNAQYLTSVDRQKAELTAE